MIVGSVRRHVGVIEKITRREGIIIKMEKKAFMALKNNIELYTPISKETWSALKMIYRFRLINKHQILYKAGEIPISYCFTFRYNTDTTESNPKKILIYQLM